MGVMGVMGILNSSFFILNSSLFTFHLCLRSLSMGINAQEYKQQERESPQ